MLFSCYLYSFQITISSPFAIIKIIYFNLYLLFLNWLVIIFNTVYKNNLIHAVVLLFTKFEIQTLYYYHYIKYKNLLTRYY